MCKHSFLLKFISIIWISSVISQGLQSPCPSADPVIVNDVAFIKLGTYRGFADDGSEYQKSYFISRYSKTPWAESKAICRAFDLEFTTLESNSELQSFLNIIDNNSYLRTISDTFFWIDGISLTPKSKTDWYWTKSGKKLTFSLPWALNQPDFLRVDEFCLALGKSSNQKFGFHDGICSASISFVCQRIELYVP
ncbi:hypothetical protein ACKWTF_008859 [Chironomus riparius]